MRPTLIITVPCFNEEAVLGETVGRLSALLDRMRQDPDGIAPESRILLVNDGSTDTTWDIIRSLHETNGYVCGINLAGNTGHQNALMAGMETAREMGDAIVSIDADLQDDIRVIPDMVRHYLEGCDIVYGVRKERKSDSWFKRTSAQAFYRLMKDLGVKSVYNHADFRLMSRRAVEQLCRFREKNLFLRGIVPTLGYKTACVYYDRTERMAGESKYPLRRMLHLALDGITSFSNKPVRLIFEAGMLLVLVSLGILVYILCAWANGHTVSGWTSLILSVWFLGGLVLLSVGVVGEYIGKIYLEVKDRPRFIIESKLIQ